MVRWWVKDGQVANGLVFTSAAYVRLRLNRELFESLWPSSKTYECLPKPGTVYTTHCDTWLTQIAK